MRKLRGRPFGNRENPSCKDVATVLQSYLDGELEEADIPTVERHLDACRDCGMESEMYDTIKSRIAARSVAVDPAIIDRLQAFTSSITTGMPASPVQDLPDAVDDAAETTDS